MNDDHICPTTATPRSPRAPPLSGSNYGRGGSPNQRARSGTTPSRTSRRMLEAKYDDHRGNLLSLATWMGFGPEDAEDIAQETLLALFTREGTIGSRGDGLLDSLAAGSVVARRRSNHCQLRLDSALTDAAVATRSERDNRGASWLSREAGPPSRRSR